LEQPKVEEVAPLQLQLVLQCRHALWCHDGIWEVEIASLLVMDDCLLTCTMLPLFSFASPLFTLQAVF
jgi:hypothetical protein